MLISSLLLRCCCDLYPNVLVHAGPCKVRQSPPRNPSRHQSVVARHKVCLISSTLLRVSTTMGYATRGPHTANLCGYGRIASRQPRVCDQQPHQDLRESPHQASARNTEFLLHHRTDFHDSNFSASAIIIPNLLPVISSHLTRSLNQYPTLHELPHPFHLHRFYQKPPFSTSSPPQIPLQLPNEVPTQAGLRDGVSVSQALQLAMSTGITGRGCDPPPRAPTPSGSKITSSFNDRTVITLETKQPVIGNMLLSSCPGKKSTSLDQFHSLLRTSDISSAVRLAGPVNGRTGVCRDLSRDLERMRLLGVGCIVWYFLVPQGFSQAQTKLAL